MFPYSNIIYWHDCGVMWFALSTVCVRLREVCVALTACTWKCWFIAVEWNWAHYTQHMHAIAARQMTTQLKAKFSADQTTKQQKEIEIGRERGRKWQENDENGKKQRAKQTEKLLNTFTGTTNTRNTLWWTLIIIFIICIFHSPPVMAIRLLLLLCLVSFVQYIFKSQTHKVKQWMSLKMFAKYTRYSLVAWFVQSFCLVVRSSAHFTDKYQYMCISIKIIITL